MEKITGTKYEKLANDVVSIHEGNGVKLVGHFDNYGMNKFYPSDKGIQFSFYWDSLSEVKTPDGLIAFGPKSGGTLSFESVQQSLIEYFGLEFIEERIGLQGEKWLIYQATKNIPG